MTQRPVLFDVDGVLADFMGGCLDYINKRDGTSLTSADVPGDIRNCSFWGDDCDALVRSPGFARSLKSFVEGCRAVGALLCAGERIVFVTSPFGNAPTWCHDRQKWLEDYFSVSRDDVIFARSKQYVDGYVLVDDLYRNVVDWENYCPHPDFPRLALLMDQPWNQTTPLDPYPYRRVSTAEEIVTAVLRAKRESE